METELLTEATETELLGEEDGGYRDATLRVNHWVLTLR
jgi:hypothetical protein